MENGIVIRLAGVEQPATRILHQDVITIGTAPDCDLVVGTEVVALPPESVFLTLRRREGAYRLATVEPMAGITRDGEAVTVGETIQDGDTVYFGATGIRLRFFALSETESITGSLRLGGAVLASMRTGKADLDNAADATRQKRLVPRTDVAIVFLKQLVRELVNEIPRRLLYALAGLAVFFILLFIYFPTLSFLEGRRNNRAISELKDTTRAEMDKLREEMRQTREQQLSLQHSLSLPEIIVSTYGQGVCLIYGVYSFVDQRVGREVRFKEPSYVENPIGPDGNVNLSVEGNGRIYEIEFMGTGFLADKGLILTNRHVVQAWEDDDLASLIIGKGFRPKLKELLAYFPNSPQSFSMRPLELMQDQDVAICSFEQGEAALSVLPLDELGENIASGQQVVLLGYPAGLEGLKARVDQINGSGRLRMGNVPYQTQLNELAANNKIRPQSTQGHISDIAPHLTYDARTDEGGSGGPVFGSNGKVIGINQAILLNSSTTNFGVPIRYGVELVKKHKLASPMPSPGL